MTPTPTAGPAASKEGRMTEEQLVEAMADAYNPAWANKIPGEPDEVYAAYRTRIRRDMSRVLAVVREHIALELEAESECTPCSEDALVVRGCADLVRASGSYDRVDEIISARKHDGAALADAQASLALVSQNRDALAEDLAETQAALAEARERIAVLDQALEWYAEPVAPLAMSEQTLAAEILAELARARAKFPGPNVTTLALMEEVGELAKATFEESRERVRKEAVQVACMAMRVVLDGDATLDEWRAARGLNPLIAAQTTSEAALAEPHDEARRLGLE